MDLRHFDELEKCYHVLTAGTSWTQTLYSVPVDFSLSAKKIKDQNAREPRYIAKFNLEGYIVKPSGGKLSRGKVTITAEVPVNGQPKATIEMTGQPKRVVVFTNNKLHEVLNTYPRTLITKHKYSNALIIENAITGEFLVTAQTLDMRLTKFIQKTQTQLTGLCGSSSLLMKGKELKGTKTCTYTKPILEVASQRVQTGSCPQLEGPVKTELEKEKAKCEEASFHEVFGQGSGNGMALKYGGEHFNSGIAGGMGKGSGSGRGGYAMGGVSGSGGNGMGGDYEIGSKRPCFDDLHDCEFQEQLNGCPNLLKQGHCAKHCGLCHNW